MRTRIDPDDVLTNCSEDAIDAYAKARINEKTAYMQLSSFAKARPLRMFFGDS